MYMRITTLFVSLSVTLLGFTFVGYCQAGKVVYNDTAFVAAMLRAHNGYRSEQQLQPFTWSDALAKDAAAWAQQLASEDKHQHDMSIRGKEGENLWWGTAGAFSHTQMVDFWGNEKKDFKYGVFPDCATTQGAMVGHYTQIVWKDTKSIGCALAGNGKTDFLVCRYGPAGNIVGQKPY
jgi:hypothetical protein